MFYEDEVDIHLNPKIGRDWMLTGQQKVVITPGQNTKRYFAGALAADRSDFVFVSSTRKNSDLFVTLLEKLQAKYPNARSIHLILDNFVIHSSRRVERYLKEHGERIRLHFLPPYCPNDNKIERLWQDLHANVTRNHRARSIVELMRNARRYLNALGRRCRKHVSAHRARARDAA